MSSPSPDQSSIDVRIQVLGQLFDSLDPSPNREKDLSPRIDEYIVDGVNELPSGGPLGLTVYLDQPAGHPDEETLIGDAIRAHFARRAHILRRRLRQLLRRGLVSLGIGLTFLIAVFLIGQSVGRLMGVSALARLFRESLLIVGWVAMWRPLEIFLYDWWPIVGERRIRDRLSRIAVRIVLGRSGPDRLDFSSDR